jgi:hypothetical protein
MDNNKLLDKIIENMYDYDNVADFEIDFITKFLEDHNINCSFYELEVIYINEPEKEIMTLEDFMHYFAGRLLEKIKNDIKKLRKE